MKGRLRLALAAYLGLWGFVGACAVYGVAQAGYSATLAGAGALLLFVLVNGSLAYRARVRQLKSQGEVPPPYFRYLFFPQGLPRRNEAAPRSTHLLVGIASTLLGVFLVFCGIALVLDAEWSLISQPLLVAALCFMVVAMGLAFLWLAWRLLSFASKVPADVA